MKKLFLLLSFAAFAAPAFSATSFQTDPTSTTGSTASVTVLLTGAPANDLILGYGFNVVVTNTSIATFAGFTPAAAFTAAGTLPTGTNVLASGLVDTSFGYVEPYALVTLLFNRVALGTTTFSVTGNPTDPNQGVVYLNANTEAVSLNGTLNFVPEPATFGLAGAALAGLIALRRRRS